MDVNSDTNEKLLYVLDYERGLLVVDITDLKKIVNKKNHLSLSVQLICMLKSLEQDLLVFMKIRFSLLRRHKITKILQLSYLSIFQPTPTTLIATIWMKWPFMMFRYLISLQFLLAMMHIKWSIIHYTGISSIQLLRNILTSRKVICKRSNWWQLKIKNISVTIFLLESASMNLKFSKCTVVLLPSSAGLILFLMK